VLLGCVAVQPITRAAAKVKQPLRFYTADLLWLMVLLQFPLVYLAYAKQWQPQDMLLFCGFLLLIMVGGIWLGGVTMLSGLNIVSPWRRGTLLVVILPSVVLLCVVGGPAMGIFCFDALHAYGWSYGRSGASLRNYLEYLSGAAILTTIVSVGCRRLSYWVLAGREADAEES